MFTLIAQILVSTIALFILYVLIYSGIAKRSAMNELQRLKEEQEERRKNNKKEFSKMIKKEHESDK